MTCPCKALSATGDPKGHVTANAIGGLGKARRGRAPSGRFCVVSRAGKIVGCYRSQATATKVARGFGDKFRVRER